MKKETVIGGIMAASFVGVLGFIGFTVWRAQQAEDKPLAQTTTNKQKSSSNQSVLSVGDDNNGLGGGLQQDKAQNQARPAESNSKTVSPSSFSEYNKYKESQSALFADLEVGSGTVVAAGKKLSIEYKAWLTDGRLVEQTGKDTFVMTAGEGKVIPGLEQGLAGMKAGGKRLIIVPPAVGFGSQQKDGIPPNSILIFETKLLKVE